MAEVVLAQFASDDPVLAPSLLVTSAGTANWHVDKPMDSRARTALDKAGFNAVGSLAEFANAEFLDRLDLTVVMTREQRHDVQTRRSEGDSPVILLRSILDSTHDLDLSDPYYGTSQDFDACLNVIIPACQELARGLRLGGAKYVASLPAK
jgi:protein-tyrosine phosphatase